MRYEFFIALRYIFGKRRQRFISVITIISILGIAVGVAALIATLAVMSGFDSELKLRIVGSNPHIFIEKQLGITNADKISKDINSIEGVKGSFPYIHSQGIIEFRDRAQGIAIKSVDSNNAIDASKVMPFLISVAADEKLDNGLIIGTELASSLGLYIGDEVTLLTPALGKPYRIKITGIFKSGMYDYDANIIFSGLENLAAIFNNNSAVSGIGVDCLSLASCVAIKEKIQKHLGTRFIVSTWAERNKNLFSAIQLEKLAMFVVLTLIIIVACFSIIGVLVMTVMEKAKDIGILKAIGASKKGIITIFSIQGFVIGAMGVIFGLVGGLFASFLLKTFVRLPREIYYIDRIPIKFQVADSIIIVMAALVVSLLATIYPAYQASKLQPTQTLRYE